jgi:hypothetical protein
MATAEEYGAWIIKNADKKGTPDFEKVAAAYQQARAQEQEGSSPEITYTYPREGTAEPTVETASEIPGPRNYALSEVPGAMIRNAPASGLKVAGDVVTAVTSPIQTTTGLGDLLGGIMEPVTPNILYGGDSRERALTARDNFTKYLADRFGGTEELKRTMAEDPIGFLGDLSTVFSGGAGMAKLAGKGTRAITKTAEVGPIESKLVKGFDTAAKYTNPLTPIAAGGGYVVNKFSGGAERSAAKIAREAAGEDLPKIEALIRSRQGNLSAAELFADLDRNQIQALGELARVKDTKNFYSKLDQFREQTRQNTLNNLAGGATNTEILNNLVKSKEALTDVTTPMRETNMAAANTGKLKQGLENEAATLGKVAADKVDDVRRFTAARQRLNAAKTQADLSPNVSKDRLKFADEMEDAAERVAAKAADDSLKYGEGARFAQARADSLAAHGLKPLDTDGIIRDINGKLNNPSIGVSDVNRKVLSTVANKIKEWTARNGGVIDVEALYRIRKDTVNEVIDSLGKEPKASAKYASKLLAEVRPLIDDAIIKAGGTGWKDYLDTFSHGMDVINQRKMAQVARDLYNAKDKSGFIKLVRGESPELVEQIFGSGRIDLKAEMGNKYKMLDDVASELERGQKIVAGAEKGAADIKDIFTQNLFKLRLPFFGVKATAGNVILRELSGKINTKTAKILEKGFESGKNFEDMLNEVPFGDRGRVYKAFERYGPELTAGKFNAARTLSNALAPQDQNNLNRR